MHSISYGILDFSLDFILFPDNQYSLDSNMMTMAPTYFIQRSDPMDPASALIFFPEKGSDELHDALRVAFPHLGNLQARMRQAVIEFYLTEQEQEAFAQFNSPSVSDSSQDFNNNSFDSMPLFSNDISFPNTPAMSNKISPELFNFPMSSLPSDMPSLFPSTPVISEASLSTSPAPSSQSAVPTQEQLSTVWALPSRPDAKVHKRRCMTEDEKLAYKKKRLQGACSDCKRRRRKCQHSLQSQTQVEAGPASLDSRRVPKDLTSHTEPQYIRGGRTLAVSDQQTLQQHTGVKRQPLAPLDPLLYEPLHTSSSSRATHDRGASSRNRTLASNSQPLVSEQLQLQTSSSVLQDRSAAGRTKPAASKQSLISDSLLSHVGGSVLQDRNATSRTGHSTSGSSLVSDSHRVTASRQLLERETRADDLQRFPQQRRVHSSDQSSPQRRQHRARAVLMHTTDSPTTTYNSQLKQAERYLMSQSLQNLAGHHPAGHANQSAPRIPISQQSFQQPFICNEEGLSRSALEATMTALCDMFLPQKTLSWHTDMSAQNESATPLCVG